MSKIQRTVLPAKIQRMAKTSSKMLPRSTDLQILQIAQMMSRTGRQRTIFQMRGKLSIDLTKFDINIPPISKNILSLF